MIDPSTLLATTHAPLSKPPSASDEHTALSSVDPTPRPSSRPSDSSSDVPLLRPSVRQDGPLHLGTSIDQPVPSTGDATNHLAVVLFVGDDNDDKAPPTTSADHPGPSAGDAKKQLHSAKTVAIRTYLDKNLGPGHWDPIRSRHLVVIFL